MDCDPADKGHLPLHMQYPARGISFQVGFAKWPRPAGRGHQRRLPGPVPVLRGAHVRQRDGDSWHVADAPLAGDADCVLRASGGGAIRAAVRSAPGPGACTTASYSKQLRCLVRRLAADTGPRLGRPTMPTHPDVDRAPRVVFAELCAVESCMYMCLFCLTLYV